MSQKKSERPQTNGSGGGKNDYRLGTSSWAGLWKVFLGIGVVAIGAAAAMAGGDPKRFAFSYLFGFVTFLTIGLGAMFFVLVQHLTGAGWSVTVRRTAEFFMWGLPWMGIFAVPVLLMGTTLFPWMSHGGGEHHANIGIVSDAHAQESHGSGGGRGLGAGAGHGDHAGTAPQADPSRPADAPGAAAGHDVAAHGAHGGPDVAAHGGHDPHAGHHGASASPTGHGSSGHGSSHADDPEHVNHAATIAKKAPFLNKNFFYARAFGYFLIWGFVAWRLFRMSTSQDDSKDPKLTLAAQRMAPISMILFGLSLTFAAFDWIMSLEPAWYSTIFGVNIFASSVVSSLSMIIVVTMGLRESGLLKNAVTVEHYHDLGKLLFGFLVFWAYIAFSQFMLIWYASIPEETTFFHTRWDHGPWRTISLLLVTAHFIFPFFLLMSRNTKRNLSILRFGAIWVLCVHVLEMYWFVMPNILQDNYAFHFFDVLCPVGIGGVYLGLVFYKMGRHALIPLGDPRLERALKFENM